MNNIGSPFLVLLFNVFLTKKARYEGVQFQNEVDKYLGPIRSSDTNYREKTKIEICAYALTSISEINWDHSIINIEIADDYSEEEKIWILNYAKKLFPNGTVSSNRAKTRSEYLNIFEKIYRVNKNAYILFIPNHDHIFMGYDKNLVMEFTKLLQTKERNSSLPTRLCYSNQLENILAIRNNSPITGLYLLGGKIVEETNEYLLVERENYAWDSYYLTSLSVIKNYFKESKNEGYCPRGEDCFSYPFPKVKNLALIPKVKLFEHYDGSHHVFGFKTLRYYRNKFSDRVPPLFIPPGFFDGQIKIKIGYSLYDKEYINFGTTENFIYLTNSKYGVDLNPMTFSIPYFWKCRIVETKIIKNDEYEMLMKNKKNIELENPFYDFPVEIINKRNRDFKKMISAVDIQSYYEKTVYSDSIIQKINNLFKKIN